MPASNWYDAHKVEAAAALNRAKAAPKDRAVPCTLVRMKDGAHFLCAGSTESKVNAMVRDARQAGGKVLSGGILFSENGQTIFEVSMGALPAKGKCVEAAATAGAPLANLVIRAAAGANLAAGDGEPAAAAPPAPPPAAPASASPADAGAAIRDALARLVPQIQQAVQGHPDRKNDLLGPVARCKKQLEAGQTAEAKVSLRELVGLLQGLKPVAAAPAVAGAPPPPPPAPPQANGTAPTGEPGKAPFSRVAFTKTRLAWDQTRKKIQAELQKLEQAILEGCADQDEFDPAGVAAGAKSLYTILDKLDTRLIDKLDEALNAEDEGKRDQFHAEAGKIVQEYLAFVNSDSLMAEIDANGFTPVAVRQTAVAALNLLASKL